MLSIANAVPCHDPPPHRPPYVPPQGVNPIRSHLALAWVANLEVVYPNRFWFTLRLPLPKVLFLYYNSKMHKQCGLLVVVLAVLLAVCIHAAEKPDFSGTWKLDLGNSDFGPMPRPYRWERKVVHRDPRLEYATTQSGPQGEFTVEMAFTTDGKEASNRMRGQEVKGTAKWEGNKLVIDLTMEFNGPVKIREHWNVSPDGRILTISRRIASSRGEFEGKLVAVKQ